MLVLALLACGSPSSDVQKTPPAVVPKDQEQEDPLDAVLPHDRHSPSEPWTDAKAGGTGHRGAILKDTPVEGVTCEAGFPFVLYDADPEGRRFTCTLASEATIGPYTLSAGASPVLWVGGGVASVAFESLSPPADRLDLDGVPCRDFARFHPDGHLARCVLADERTSADGAKLSAGTTVDVSPGGLRAVGP